MMNRKPPNLVFVFSDQQSFDMLGCAGNPHIKTPNLDAFSREGVRFEHAVANCPLCTPCRSMLLSGKHPLHNNCIENDRPLLHRDKIGPGFGHVLRDAGYRMGYVGKWHLLGGDRKRPIPAGPDRQGFDDYFASNNCDMNYHPDHCFHWTEEGEKVLFGTWEAAGQTEQALGFLDGCVGEQPFCLFLSWHPPHNHFGGEWKAYSGFDAPAEFKALYNEDEIVPRGQLPNTPENRRMTLGYYAMCSEIDHHFGRLINKLEEIGHADDTLVVFTSDHGETFGAHAAQCHKGNPEDVSVRIPLLMRLPGVISSDHVSRLLIGILDLPPTLLGLMGHKAPASWEGMDLSSAIRRHDDDAVDSVPIFNFKPSWRGVYTRRYTFAMENVERTPGMQLLFKSDLPDQRSIVQNFNVLYDREKDPLQLNNLVNASEHLDTIAMLTKLTYDWCAKFNDPFLSYQRLIALMDSHQGEI
jgi:arylsulfatase A-like enzyme